MRKATIPTDFWNRKVVKQLSHNVLIVYIYLRTSPLFHQSGLFQIPVRTISNDLDLDKDRVLTYLQQLVDAHVIMYDELDGFIYIPGLLRDELGALSEHDPRITKLQKHYQDFPSRRLAERFFSDYTTDYHLFDSISRLEIMEQIETLIQQFSIEAQPEVKEAIEALKLTRKSGKIAPDLIITILRRWLCLDVGKVLHGIRTYLKDKHHLTGKRENYLLAIMQNTTDANINHIAVGRKNYSKTTNHNLLIFEQLEQE